MNELIKVTTNENGQQVTSGRELHEFLEVKTPYTQWFEDMCRYGFSESVDFIKLNELSEKMKVQESLNGALLIML